MKKSTIAFVSDYFAYNAGSKAVQDVLSLAEECGYSIYYIKLSKRHLMSFKYYYAIIKGFVDIFLCFLKSDRVLIQYPIYIKRYKFFIYILLRIYKAKCIVIVHDLLSYQLGVMDFNNEVSIIKNADRIIVHNDKMLELLADAGIAKDKMRKLYVFDYLTEKNNKLNRKLSYEVCYAGNFNKSNFLKDLPSNLTTKTKYHLYGSKSRNIKECDNVLYEGIFSPNDVSEIKGDWGLAWDGDSCLKLDGIIGQYLKIISPHKVSLYIAAELPIIIGEQSALSKYVTSNNLGISIKTIKDIDMAIGSVSAGQYDSMLKAIKCESSRIRSGANLKNILRDI